MATTMTERHLRAALALVQQGECVEVVFTRFDATFRLLGRGKLPATVRLCRWNEGDTIDGEIGLSEIGLSKATAARLEAIAAAQTPELARAISWARQAAARRKVAGAS